MSVVNSFMIGVGFYRIRFITDCSYLWGNTTSKRKSLLFEVSVLTRNSRYKNWLQNKNRFYLGLLDYFKVVNFKNIINVVNN